MSHTVLELVKKARLLELRSLEVDLVLERGIITERELLIPFFFSYSDLLFERIELRNRECYIRKCE